ncbi:MAG: DUF1194 domain-containing protein [Pseudomonadota bacterium]
MRALIALIAMLGLALPGAARADHPFVDVELVLAVDVSRSMSPRELEIQRRGYAEALTSPDVIAAIQDGPHGRIALTYVEWAGTFSQRTIIGWTLVATAEDAARVAGRLTAKFDDSLRRTSISGLIDYAVPLFDQNDYQGLRRVIDISGDGPNNMGRPVTAARDAALAKGISINGLPLMTKEGLGMQWHLDDLDLYYRDCVIGGPAAFVVPVLDWAHFADAVRQKLVLELVGRPPARIFRAQARPPYDCLIGEKIWDDMMNWGN